MITRCAKLFLLIVIILGCNPCTNSLASDLLVSNSDISILGEAWFNNSIEQIDATLKKSSYISDDEYIPLLSYKNPYTQPSHILIELDKDNEIEVVNMFYSDKDQMQHITQIINTLSGISIQKQSSIENQIVSQHNEYQYTIVPFDIIDLSKGHICKDFVFTIEKIKPCTVIASCGDDSLLIENICTKNDNLSFIITNNSPCTIKQVCGEILIYKNAEIILTDTWGTWAHCAFRESTYNINVSGIPKDATYIEIRITSYLEDDFLLIQPNHQIIYVCELN